MSNDRTPETTPDHTPGPWRTCRKGECSCFTVMSDNHPVAEVTHGDWGDNYPALRLVGDSTFDQKIEAYMEQITYGSIGEKTARANWHLIAAAPDLLASLQEIVAEWGCPNTPKWHRAASAIAKATCAHVEVSGP